MRWSEIQASGLSLSRVEERQWLGMQGVDPQNDPREDWRDDPSPAEMAEMMDYAERQAA